MNMRLVQPADKRDQPRFEPPSTDQWEILAVQEGLFAAVQKYGAARVQTWLRTMAALAGKGLDQ